jgi:hypothetical protein
MNARPDAGPESVWLARILGAGAILETGVGLVLLVDPSALASLLLLSPLEGAGLVFARIGEGRLPNARLSDLPGHRLERTGCAGHSTERWASCVP